MKGILRLQPWGGCQTITMLTDHGSFTRGVQKALSEKWKGMGLTV